MGWGDRLSNWIDGAADLATDLQTFRDDLANGTQPIDATVKPPPPPLLDSFIPAGVSISPEVRKAGQLALAGVVGIVVLFALRK